MTQKKSFFRNHRKKIIAISFLGLATLLFMNWIGFKHVPGHIQSFWWNNIKCRFDPEYYEKEDIDWEREKILSDSLNSAIKNQNKIVESIAGDFDGNGTIEYAFISPNNGYVNFSKGNLPNVDVLGKLDPKNAKLFKEGDLNNDGADDFSVYIYGNGFNNLYTFMFKPDFPWTQSLNIILKSDEKASDEEINNKVFRKNNQIYYYDEEDIENLSSGRTKFQYKLVRKNLKDYEKEN